MGGHPDRVMLTSCGPAKASYLSCGVLSAPCAPPRWCWRYITHSCSAGLIHYGCGTAVLVHLLYCWASLTSRGSQALQTRYSCPNIAHREHLARKAETLYVHNLSGILETAVRATNAQYDDADIIARLDVRLLEVSPGDIGWDVFSLDYKVDGPIRTVRSVGQ